MDPLQSSVKTVDSIPPEHMGCLEVNTVFLFSNVSNQAIELSLSPVPVRKMQATQKHFGRHSKRCDQCIHTLEIK